MSEIITNKLTGKTAAGDVTITSEGGSATMQLQQGVAKQWHQYDQNNTTVDGSLNVSSATDIATGRYTPNHTNNMSNTTDIAVTGITNHDNGDSYPRYMSIAHDNSDTFATSGVSLKTMYATYNLADQKHNFGAIHGDLA